MIADDLDTLDAHQLRDALRTARADAAFDVHHEPENTACSCGQAMQRIGEDVAEKLDYQPGVFTVERHIRGEWVCKCCERIVQAPVAPHIIGMGLPTTGLLAQVLIAKLPGPPAAVPAGGHLRACRSRHRARHTGPVGRRVRRAAAAAGGRAGCGTAAPAGASRRRDTRGDGLNLSTKKTRKREFLEEMERVVPWKVLVEIIEPHWPKSKTGRPPFAIETMLRIHYMHQWFGLSDPAMEEALHDVPLYLEFAGLGSGASRIPDETTILRLRHLLEKHDLAVDMLRVVNDLLQRKGLLLKTGTAVDATLISAPSSTKNASGERDPSKKGNQWYFGMKAHIGVDAESGLVHSVSGTAGNVNDVVEANHLLHGEERVVFADSGYRGANRRPDAKPGVDWRIARRPSSRNPAENEGRLGRLIDEIEHLKASVRAKVEHAFRVVKRQFGHTKVRYRGLTKNTAQLHTLFALTNLC